jgi:hypothetical protein
MRDSLWWQIFGTQIIQNGNKNFWVIQEHNAIVVAVIVSTFPSSTEHLGKQRTFYLTKSGSFGG